METQTAPGIHAAMVAIMAEGPSVKKGRTNSQQNYQFRGIDDLYLECQPLMAKHGVHVVPHRVVEDSLFERQSKREGGATIIHVRQRIEFRFFHVDGSFVSVETTGEAMDFGGDKASNKAMSAAMKYALIQAFSIPTDEPIDVENYSPEAGSAAPPRAPKPGPPRRPPPGPPQSPPAEGAKEEVVPVYGKAPGSSVWGLQPDPAPKLAANQQARVKILQKELGIDDKLWRERLFHQYGKTSSSDLSATEAEDWIVRLEASKRRREKPAPGPT